MLQGTPICVAGLSSVRNNLPAFEKPALQPLDENHE
jgi:hypothetical protein